jgi:hypothetical protein
MAPMATKANVKAIVETAAQRRCQDLLDEIARKKSMIAEAFVDVGEALVEIEKRELYKALGHPTFGDLLNKRGVLGTSQAYKLMAIVRAMPKRQALGLGTEKAYALVRYAKATAKQDFVTELVAKGVTIGGKRRLLDDITVAELNAETRRTSRNRANATRDPERHAALGQVKKGKARLRALGVTVSAAVHRSPRGLRVTLELSVEDFIAMTSRS